MIINDRTRKEPIEKRIFGVGNQALRRKPNKIKIKKMESLGKGIHFIRYT